jgi:hypothetical protein
MHRYNDKYGYGAILRHYCGVDDAVPIWGEVQHSLFLNIRYFTADGTLGPAREQLQRFPRLLSWQTLLPFPHQVPIGDPLFYQSDHSDFEGGDSALALREPKSFNVFLPKLNDELDLSTRLAVYASGVRQAAELSGTTPICVALHPREKSVRAEMQRVLGRLAEVVWAPDDFPGGPTAWSTQLMRDSQTVISDYFGAHVFRSVALFETPVALVGERVFNPAVHLMMLPLLRDFFDAMGDFPAQNEIARRVLGVEYVRPREELRDILGFTGVKKLLGRPVRVVYQRVRRAKVRKRRHS